LRKTLITLLITLAACSGTSGEMFTPDAAVEPDMFVPPPAPAISALDPARGPLAGGTQVTITGSGFTLDDAVLFGGTAVDAITSSETTITFTTPPSKIPGPVDVTVTNANGADTLADAFSYNPSPTVTSIAPTRGRLAGGTLVTITGSGFADLEPGTNAVSLVGFDCGKVTVASDTELTCVTGGPATCTTGSGDVVVTNANGTATLVDAFSYAPGPIYVADGRGEARGSLHQLDLCAGTVTAIGPIGFAITGLAFTDDGTLYASQTDACPAALVEIDVATGAGTSIGPLVASAPPINHCSMADLTAIGPQLYGWSQSIPGLVSVDRTNGAVTVIGSGAKSIGCGIAANAAGTIYAALNGAFGPLRTLDPATGSMTTVATMSGTHGGALMGLTFHEGELYGVRKDVTPHLVKIDAVTGIVTNLFALSTIADAIASPTPQ
jgi:hypothetical protein